MKSKLLGQEVCYDYVLESGTISFSNNGWKNLVPVVDSIFSILIRMPGVGRLM